MGSRALPRAFSSRQGASARLGGRGDAPDAAGRRRSRRSTAFGRLAGPCRLAKHEAIAGARLCPLAVPPGLYPELQPAEPLWPLTTTALMNRHFVDLEELEDAQARRCVALQQRRDLIPFSHPLSLVAAAH